LKQKVLENGGEELAEAGRRVVLYDTAHGQYRRMVSGFKLRIGGIMSKIAVCTMAAALAFGVSVVTKEAKAQDAGGALFKTKCAACHGPDGKGETAMGKANKLRDLGSAEVQKQSDAELSTIIENGKGKMPPYGKSLKPEQVKDLVTYLRSLAKK
jgi:cytochrome c6